VQIFAINSSYNYRKNNNQLAFKSKAVVEDTAILMRYFKVADLKICLKKIRLGNSEALNEYLGKVFDELNHNLTKRMFNVTTQINEDGTKTFSHIPSPNEKITYTLGNNRISCRSDKPSGLFSEMIFSLGEGRIKKDEISGFKDRISKIDNISKNKNLILVEDGNRFV
jgi:hypothetical protein